MQSASISSSQQPSCIQQQPVRQSASCMLLLLLQARPVLSRPVTGTAQHATVSTSTQLTRVGCKKGATGKSVTCFVFLQSSQRYYDLPQQVAQLPQRDRAAGWVSNGQKWKTGTERNIYGQYRSIFNHSDVFGQQKNRNRRKNAK